MITPEGQEVAAKTTPLEVTKTKNTAMVKKAKELLTKPMEVKELMDSLENYYVFEKNEHYTSAQLKEVAMKVAADLAPVVEVEEEIVLPKTK